MALTDFIGADGKGRTVTPSDRLPVDIGSATVNLNGDVIAKFDGVEDALGTPADAAAAGDSATSGLIGLVKRLLGKLPSGFQQGSGAITATTTRVTLATDGPGVAALTSIDTKTPALVGGAVPVLSSVATRAPTTTSIASSATSVTILAANANRKGISICNDSTASLRLSFATPATAANAFIVVPAGAFLLLDQQLIVNGTIYGIWASVNGTAQVTEYV